MSVGDVSAFRAIEAAGIRAGDLRVSAAQFERAVAHLEIKAGWQFECVEKVGGAHPVDFRGESDMHPEPSGIRMRDQLQPGPRLGDAGYLECAEVIANAEGNDDTLATLPAGLFDQFAGENEGQTAAIQPLAAFADVQTGVRA